MATLMESKTTARQHALIKAVLIAQTNSLGTLEAPIVEDLLRKNRCRSVLDVGCGEGSFLLDVAAGLKSTRFLGIDHNELARPGRPARPAAAGPRQREIRSGVLRSDVRGRPTGRRDHALHASTQLPPVGFSGRGIRPAEEERIVRGPGIA